MRSLLLSLGTLFAMTGSLTAQSVNLTEGPLVDNFFRVELSMSLKGEAKFVQDGQPQKVPQSAQAKHAYLEKVLDAKDGLAQRAARQYKEAQAEISIDGKVSKRTFRPQRTFLVAQHYKDQAFLYSPEGSLTHEEVDLTEHFDTLAVTGLLPGKALGVGGTWTVARPVVQALCDLEGLVSHDVTGTLDKVEADIAHFKVVGTVTGIDLGASVKILVQAQGQFDVKQKRLVALTWNQSDQRDQGPASPALSAGVAVSLKRAAIAETPELNNFRLVAIPAAKDPPADLSQILHADTKHGFEIQHSRDWTRVAQTTKHAVWRLIDQGDWVAQVTVTPWKKMPAKEMMAFDDFSKEMSETIGWTEDKVLQADKNVDLPNGNKAYRISASGELDEAPAVQFFYLIASPQGDQVVVAFTMTPNQVQKLGTRDLTFVQHIAFPVVQPAVIGEPISETATPAPKKD